jgi:uncharacterized protein (DUF427 family)
VTIERVEPGPGEESVWDYPRPPRVEESSRLVQVRFAGTVIAESRNAKRVLETSHPPVFYIPPEDIRREFLVENRRSTWCEFKGSARYYDVKVGDAIAAAAGWYYPTPTPGFEIITNHVAFYPSAMEACLVDGERVRAQEGDFYGGWITSEIVGPFKGAPGTRGW